MVEIHRKCENRSKTPKNVRNSAGKKCKNFEKKIVENWQNTKKTAQFTENFRKSDKKNGKIVEDGQNDQNPKIVKNLIKQEGTSSSLTQICNALWTRKCKSIVESLEIRESVIPGGKPRVRESVCRGGGGGPKSIWRTRKFLQNSKIIWNFRLQIEGLNRRPRLWFQGHTFFLEGNVHL